MTKEKWPTEARTRGAENQIGSGTDIAKIRKSAGSSNRVHLLEFDPEAPILEAHVRFLPALTAHYITRMAAHLIRRGDGAALAGYAHGKAEIEP